VERHPHPGGDLNHGRTLPFASRRGRAVAVLALALGTCAMLASGASALTAKQKRQRCFPRRTTTKLVSATARVYETDDALRGCLFSTGRKWTLDENDGIVKVAKARALNGRFVAWDLDYSPGCRGQCPPGTTITHTLNVMDLRNGRARSVRTTDDRVGVTTRGALVWTSSGATSTVSLLVLDADGERTLDSGDVDKTFLRVFGTYVLWRTGGQNHWTRLL
jgi:hypothetical protein